MGKYFNLEKINKVLRRRKISKKKVFFAGVILLGTISLFVYGFYKNQGGVLALKNHKVVLAEKGFSPRELTIGIGDTVTFTTERSESFWPASDPHPTHEGLPGFDPKKPIDSKESWSFQFSEAGIFPYHNHLSVSFRGEIVVAGESLGADCSGECFDKIIKKTVKKDGIDAAYALFNKSYESGNLPRSCHWTAHKIGEAAYELFAEGVDFPISYATSYCGYGFYHGFLESLLRVKPDTKYALSFCKKVEEKLGQQGRWNCYHGIGHGFTEDPPPPETIGNPDAILAPGIKICEKLFGGSFQNLNLCLTGVYTVVAGFADEKRYGLTLDEKDPFAFCRTQPYRYQKACYGEFAPKLDRILNWDLTLLPDYIESIKDDKLVRLVVWVVPSVMMGKDVIKDDHISYIEGCRSFSGRLKDICLAGTVFGLLTQGEPEKQYTKVINFCANVRLEKEERFLCYQESFRQMRQLYPKDKIQEICNLVPEEEKFHCFEEDKLPPYDDPVFG